MASQKEVVDKIAAALNAKAGGQKPCVVCGQTRWILLEKFVVLPVVNDPTASQLGGPSISLVPAVCTNCGNTHFLNLKVLGFGDLTALKIDEDVPAKS